jgi:MFS family permease
MGEVTPLTRAQRLLAVGLVLGVTLVAFEVTAVVTAMPTIADVLDGDSLFGLASASYTLATMVALVAAGELADRRGAALPYLLSIGTFIAGLALAAAAPSMVWVVIARTMQGIGSGGLAPIAYTLVQRAFPVERHATMFAVLSAGWVLPSLFAPAVSGLLVDTVGWRWVFLGIIPLAVLVAALATPPMRHFGPTTSERPPTRIGHAVVAAAGIGALATGVRADSVWLAVPLTLVGAVLGLRALRHLLPSGTGRGSRGLPAILASRLLATATFMGVDAFVPLGVARIHGASPTVQGFVIIGAAVMWTVGQWVRARRPGIEPHRAIRNGFAVLAVGVVLTAPVLWDRWPLALVFVGWSVGGLGMGLVFNPTTIASTKYAVDGRQGQVASQVSLADSVGFSVMGAIGGGWVALADRTDFTIQGALGVNFALAALCGAAGVVVARRIVLPQS